jgi:protein TonB
MGGLLLFSQHARFCRPAAVRTAHIEPRRRAPGAVHGKAGRVLAALLLHPSFVLSSSPMRLLILALFLATTLNAQRDPIVQVGDGVTAPRPIVFPTPGSPFVTTTIAVMFVVDKEGKTREVQIVTSSGNPNFDRDAIDTVKRWRFEPARKNGVPVAVRLLIDVNINGGTNRAPSRELTKLKDDFASEDPETACAAAQKIFKKGTSGVQMLLLAEGDRRPFAAGHCVASQSVRGLTVQVAALYLMKSIYENRLPSDVAPVGPAVSEKTVNRAWETAADWAMNLQTSSLKSLRKKGISPFKGSDAVLAN